MQAGISRFLSIKKPMLTDQIHALREEYNALPNISETEFSIQAPQRPDVKLPWQKAVLQETGLEVKGDFESLLNQLSVLELCYLDAEDSVIAELNFSGILMCFNDFAQEHYIHAFEDFRKEELGDAFLSFAKKFYPIDTFYKAYDGVSVGCYLPKTEESPCEFWIWNNAGHKYKLVFRTMEEYIQAAVDCKCILSWQYFYLDTDYPDFTDSFSQLWLAPSYSEAIYRMTNALELLRQYFPGKDWGKQAQELLRVQAI